MSTKADKLRKAAARLNGDRAKMETAYRYRRGKIVGFYPCPKSYFFLAGLCAPGEFRQDALRGPGLDDIDSTTPLPIIEYRASLTNCECHPSASANDLMEMEY